MRWLSAVWMIASGSAADTRAAHALTAVGIDIPDTILQHVWPLAWGHIIFTGGYRWSNDNPWSTEKLRPLRFDRITALFAA